MAWCTRPSGGFVHRCLSRRRCRCRRARARGARCAGLGGAAGPRCAGHARGGPPPGTVLAHVGTTRAHASLHTTALNLPAARHSLPAGTARWWRPRSSRAPTRSRWETSEERSRSCGACTTPTRCRCAPPRRQQGCRRSRLRTSLGAAGLPRCAVRARAGAARRTRRRLASRLSTLGGHAWPPGPLLARHQGAHQPGVPAARRASRTRVTPRRHHSQPKSPHTTHFTHTHTYRPPTQFLGACTKKEPYILVTELMSGGSLADAFRRPQVFPMRRAVEIALDSARGLAYLHHRRAAQGAAGCGVECGVG